MKTLFRLLSPYFTIPALLTILSCTPVTAEEIKYAPFIVHTIPKCGTHCMERTIELLIGKTCLAKGLEEKSFLLSKEQNKIVRTIDPYSDEKKAVREKWGYKMVCIYRDPRDALISHLFYMRTFAGKGLKRDFFVVSKDYDQLSLDDQLTTLICGKADMSSYLSFYNDRITWAFDPLTLPIKYEDLVGSHGGGSDIKQREAIVNIANYLNVALSDQKLQFVVDNLYQPDAVKSEKHEQFKRATIGNWKKFFKPKHKKLFKQYFGKKLIELRYEKNNNW